MSTRGLSASARSTWRRGQRVRDPEEPPMRRRPDRVGAQSAQLHAPSAGPAGGARQAKKLSRVYWLPPPCPPRPAAAICRRLHISRYVHAAARCMHHYDDDDDDASIRTVSAHCTRCGVAQRWLRGRPSREGALPASMERQRMYR
eukprot:scaffold44_cov411-Prasinococcus_capsulatus_cf.AAC.55